MACAGTLSWSVAGLATPVAPIRRKDRSTNQGPIPVTPRKLEQTPRNPVPGHEQAGKTMKPEARTSTPTSKDRVLGTPASGEVRPLEIDWFEMVRRCMAGDSGAWAELVRSHHRRVYALCYR